MRHDFNLSGESADKFEFSSSAVAALRIPETIGQTLSILVWGMIIPRPQQYTDFCEKLPESVRSSLPTSLYLCGWGILTFEDVYGGKVSIAPYAPTLDLGDLRLLIGNDGKPLILSREWQVAEGLSSAEYIFDLILEQPLGHMTLTVNAAGAVTLSANPIEFVPVAEAARFPKQYSYDWARTRQLAEVVGPAQAR